jgi:antitoxin MazE
MQKIFKVGNSKAFTIPKAFADQMGLSEGSLVDVRLVNNELILRPAKPKYTLAQLLAEMPEGCDEREVDFGPDVGEEVVE